jgi:hypothetical protein
MTADGNNPADLITDDFLREIFPPGKANSFFEALYGGAEEGAFDIHLISQGFDEGRSMLLLGFRLTERPGKCMACSLTYGLPPVFKRHPVIDVRGIVEKIAGSLSPHWNVMQWDIGATQTIESNVNIIPLGLSLEQASQPANG